MTPRHTKNPCQATLLGCQIGNELTRIPTLLGCQIGNDLTKTSIWMNMWQGYLDNAPRHDLVQLCWWQRLHTDCKHNPHYSCPLHMLWARPTLVVTIASATLATWLMVSQSSHRWLTDNAIQIGMYCQLDDACCAFCFSNGLNTFG